MPGQSRKGTKTTRKAPAGRTAKPAAATSRPRKKLRHISAAEFARRLGMALRSRDAQFALFLGAGCSATSGIPTAKDLVQREWLPRLHALRAPHRDDMETWAQEVLSTYDPANPAVSYGEVFRELFPTPKERQEEIERLCDAGNPGVGYAVLAQLVTHAGGHFNVVLTTNFDDMVADALYLYTDARPLVIQHESLARFIQPTRRRPLVVKLHGDHRLSPKNTETETEELAPELANSARELIRDRGLIFQGYGGIGV